MAKYSERNRVKIKRTLENLDLSFDEMTSRMNYGFIGNITKNDKPVVQIFEGCFYVLDKEFVLGKSVLGLIEDIQSELKELNFVKFKAQTLFNL